MKRNRLVFVFFAICTIVGAHRAAGKEIGCGSTATTVAGSGLVCPSGDGGVLPDIAVHIIDTNGIPIERILGCDFWLIDCDPLNDLALCSGSYSSNALDYTDTSGNTIMHGPISGGGCAQGLSVVVMGLLVKDPATSCTTDICLPITVHSPDIDGNLEVDLVDLSVLGQAWPPAPYSFCADLNDSGAIDLVDLVEFALHIGHGCITPPCP